MRRLFENAKVVLGELIGMIVGLIWAINTKWDYEPFLIFVISTLGFIVSIALFFIKDKGDYEVKMSKENFNEISNQEKLGDVQERADFEIVNISARYIIDEVGKAILMQRDNTANAFVGINVRWKLILSTYRKINDNVVVLMNPVDEHFLHVLFIVDIDKYSSLKIANEGAVFFVVGKISKVEFRSIELLIASIEPA